MNLYSLPTTASSPDSSFRCEKYSCGMMARRCVERQQARRSANKEKVAAYEFCGSGKCEQGKAIKAAIPDYVPPTPHEVTADWNRRRRKQERSAAAPIVRPAKPKREPSTVKCARAACGVRFAKDRPEQIYCALACCKVDIREKSIAAMTAMARKCERCGKDIPLTFKRNGAADMARHKRRRFCSQKCCNVAGWASRKAEAA